MVSVDLVYNYILRLPGRGKGTSPWGVFYANKILHVKGLI